MLQLHVSGLNMLAKCGEQFRRRYIEGERAPRGMSLAIGNAVDRSVSADLRHKIDSGSLLPDEQIKDIAHDVVVAEWAAGVEPTAFDAEEGLLGSKDDAIDTSVALSTLHHTSVAPVLNPTHVQRAWVLDIEGLPIQLAGTTDIQEGSDTIRDVKTSGRSPNRDLADNSLQLTTYALAAKAHDGVIPKAVILDYLIHTPRLKLNKLVQLESTRSDKHFPHLLERVYNASRVIESGLFTPAPIDAWWCSAKWCPYHRSCRFAANPVVVSGGI